MNTIASEASIMVEAVTAGFRRFGDPAGPIVRHVCSSIAGSYWKKLGVPPINWEYGAKWIKQT